MKLFSSAQNEKSPHVIPIPLAVQGDNVFVNNISNNLNNLFL